MKSLKLRATIWVFSLLVLVGGGAYIGQMLRPAKPPILTARSFKRLGRTDLSMYFVLKNENRTPMRITNLGLAPVAEIRSISTEVGMLESPAGDESQSWNLDETIPPLSVMSFTVEMTMLDEMTLPQSITVEYQTSRLNKTQCILDFEYMGPQ